MDIVQYNSTHNTSKYTGRKIKYIVIHYTAGTTSNSGSALNTAKFFSTNPKDGSADFIVDNTTIVQYNGDIANRYTHAVGGSRYNTKGGSLYGVCTNSNSISIEVCSSNSARKMTNPNDTYYYFTDAVISKTVELTKYLMSKYNIDVNHVIRHYDVNGKPCPGVSGYGTDDKTAPKWTAFKSRLTGTTSTTTVTEAKAANTTTATTTSTKYVVRVTADSLNIRSGPGTSYAIKGKITDKGAYTIVETSGTWGKLASGAGWISLTYTKRV